MGVDIGISVYIIYIGLDRNEFNGYMAMAYYGLGLDRNESNGYGYLCIGI